jgi:hypothetical protein
MKLKSVAPQLGAQWVRLGFAVFFRRPFAFTALFAIFLFAALLLMLVPVAGGVLLLMSLPLLGLGFMVATQRTIQGQPPMPSVFVEPLRGNAAHRKTMIQLCVLYALATLAIIGLSDWVDGGRFEALQGAIAKSEALDVLFDDPQLRFGLIVRFGLAALLSIPFWYAPALIHWDGQGLAQSLFSSTLAFWRARGAFVVYVLVWALVIGFFGLLVSIVFSLLGNPQLANVAALPGALMFTTVFYTSLYFTFADSFELASAEQPAAS